MKEFEKFKEKYCKENCTVLNSCDICGGCTELNQMRLVWKAALEWVKNVDNNADGPEHNAYYTIMDAVEDELLDG